MRRSLLRRLTGIALAFVVAFAMMPVLGVESFNANAETQEDVIKDGFKLHVWGYGAGGASVAVTEYNGTAAQVKLPDSVSSEGYTYHVNSEDN